MTSENRIFQQIDDNVGEPPDCNRIVYDECDDSTGSHVRACSRVDTPVINHGDHTSAVTAAVKLPSKMTDPAKLAHLTDAAKKKY